jgi:L-threonylcarbamoyladenylate synthase
MREKFFSHFVPCSKNYIDRGIEYLSLGKSIVILTDTIYGICADALNPLAVENLYKVRQRNPKKPFVILLSDLNQLENFFGIKNLNPLEEKLLKFEKPLTVLLKVEECGWEWLRRGEDYLAFRLVKKGLIKELIKSYGKPLVAPSANWESFPPAKDVFQAFIYFSSEVPIYFNCGKVEGKPSTIVKVEGNKLLILREGLVSKEELIKEIF